MKNIMILLTLLFFSACIENSKSKEKTVESKPKTENFDWLLGSWERLNEKEGKRTFEFWEKNTNVQYAGIGYTMEGADTVWMESMLLHKTGDSWSFEAIGKDETEGTPFKLIQLKTTTFTCENADNEFPKAIRYFKEGELLKAVISGDGMEIPFDFKKVTTE